MKKIKELVKKLQPHAIPILAGAGLVLSFAPYNFAILAFLAPAVLLYCLDGKPPKAAFVAGYLFGLGLFGFGASWIYVSIFEHGGRSVWISSLITGGFVLLLSLFTAFMAWLLNRFYQIPGLKRTLLAYPVIWVLVEMLRGWALTGFPWLYLGYSQLSTNLAWLAPIGSVWLMSWAVVLTSAALYEIYVYVVKHKPNRKKLSLILGTPLMVWILAFSAKEYPWTESGPVLSVALAQGNIEQHLRWDAGLQSQIAQTYKDLTFENIDADLIVWPESAIPTALPFSSAYFQQIHQMLLLEKSALIAGVPVQASQDTYYNALMAYGQAQGAYYKHHLVPFGEYVPFEKWLRGVIAFFDLPMSSFVSASTSLPPLIAQGFQVAPSVCYEIAYPLTMRHQALNSHLVVTVSNDAWFGNSIGPYQHLQIAQVRALELGRYVLRATNTGITAVIDPRGKIQSTLPSFTQDILRDKILTYSGLTPWMQYGPWSLWLFLGLLLLPASIRSKKKK
jgi:apolipoprotein N-acyltransferase